MVSGLSTIPYSGEGWPERMLGRIGRLSLLLEAYQRLEDLPLDLQRAVRAVVGFTEPREQVLAGLPVVDEWLVLGRSVHVEDQLTTQRTWLLGGSSRPALVLDFAMFGQSLDRSLVPGTRFQGGLHFYEGSPLRALVGSREVAQPIECWPGEVGMREALAGCARVLAREPWSVYLPCCLGAVLPVEDGGEWYVTDAAGRRLPLSSSADEWSLLALSGGYPVGVFGEWDG